MDKLFLIIFLFFSTQTDSQVTQIELSRINQMPDFPTPFNMRDWSKVTKEYDALVYNNTLIGDYLPLLFTEPKGSNYPDYPLFGFPSYVGSNDPLGGEAINILPSLVGASLVGINKNQQSNSWVLWSQNYFNRSNGENIYLNNSNGSSGNDWWYDVMPNVYFYQLYDLYGSIGSADNQFEQIADVFSKAVRQMGGSDTPWQPAYMNYRAFDFKTGIPNTTSVPEPESAGTFAWILYHAYKRTKNEKYLKSAEWSMEFLHNWNSNPSYELQLPYGVYTAAKMNAELHTTYDVEKMLNWVFDRGELRGWGTIIGRWTGFDVSGLIGEANDGGNDYAFMMNGMQQAAALVPMLRYDKRFATAIGKWVLNMANASRLFYPGFLPAHLQDSEDWSTLNDSNQVIGHEALREKWNGQGPFATGDAIKGNWAATNLALYGSSSVGYLGSLLAKTNVEGILQIDVRKTDFYSDKGYPTYLYYNPFDENKTVLIDLPDTVLRIYELLTESFLVNAVSDSFLMTIPPRSARLIVLTPAEGEPSYLENRMEIQGEVVDYMQTQQTNLLPPRIQALATPHLQVEIGDTILLYGKAHDADSPQLNTLWTSEGGTFLREDTIGTWVTPLHSGFYTINWIVFDPDQLSDTAEIIVEVVAVVNKAPVIQKLVPERKYVNPGAQISILCVASDANDDDLSYQWIGGSGTVSGNLEQIFWTAPDEEGIYQVEVEVNDGFGGKANANVQLLVRTFPTGIQYTSIANYPMIESANDVSGNAFHGSPFGARLTSDRNSQSQAAYFFDGTNDFILIDNHPNLNFTGAITISCWFEANVVGDKERFLVSHGSWQNRWKLSLTPEGKIRWTIHAQDNRITDLDGSEIIHIDSFYHVVATYDGAYMMLYINGDLQTFKIFAGDIKPTDYPILIGQILPEDNNYNFGGIIDELIIWDAALTPKVIEQNKTSSIKTTSGSGFEYLDVFPNPAVDRIYFLPAERITGPIDIQCLDFSGKIYQEITYPEIIRGTDYDISFLPAGIYILNVVNDHQSLKTTFIKQKP